MNNARVEPPTDTARGKLLASYTNVSANGAVVSSTTTTTTTDSSGSSSGNHNASSGWQVALEFNGGVRAEGADQAWYRDDPRWERDAVGD